MTTTRSRWMLIVVLVGPIVLLVLGTLYEHFR
jgi:hypothetical protein